MKSAPEVRHKEITKEFSFSPTHKVEKLPTFSIFNPFIWEQWISDHTGIELKQGDLLQLPSWTDEGPTKTFFSQFPSGDVWQYTFVQWLVAYLSCKAAVLPTVVQAGSCNLKHNSMVQGIYFVYS